MITPVVLNGEIDPSCFYLRIQLKPFNTKSANMTKRHATHSVQQDQDKQEFPIPLGEGSVVIKAEREK